MTYIRGIWLFGNSLKGNLELILSRRFKTVENRVKELLGESSYVNVPDDNKILNWFLNKVLCENVSKFPSENVPLLFKNNTLGGVFSVDNIRTSDCDKIDIKSLSHISLNQLLNYMHIKNEDCKDRYVWPFMYSFKNGFFILILLSLEESILINPKILNIYRSFCGNFFEYKNEKKNKSDIFETIKLVEIRVALQLLEDLLVVIGINQQGNLIDVNKIQKIWRIMIPFGSPILDNKEVEEILSISTNIGIPKHLIRIFEENNNRSEKIVPKFKYNENQINFENEKNNNDNKLGENKVNFLLGDFYLDSVDDISEEARTDPGTEFNDDFSAAIPISGNRNLLLDVFGYGIEKLSTNKKGVDYINNSNSVYSVKFSLIEVISCFAKRHPLSTEIKHDDYLIDDYTTENFMEKIIKPYSSFISGVFKFSGKLPSSVSISCNILLPWQKVLIEDELEHLKDNNDLTEDINNNNNNNSITDFTYSKNNIFLNNKQKYKYIQPYILTKDNISCTKVSDEYFDIKKKEYRTNNDINLCFNNSELVIPFSRYKLSWKNSKISSSEIFSYWYPYEKEIPIKGYFTITPETQEPINQIAGSKSKGNFRPILIHDFKMEYCLCLDPKIVVGMEQCQITIPLIPGTLNYARNRDMIPSMIIFSHKLKTSMGNITISPDKKSIYWVINNPKELICKKISSRNFKVNDTIDSNNYKSFSSSEEKQNSIIQIRMNGSVRIRLIYKENNKVKHKNRRVVINENNNNKDRENNIVFLDKPLISPILESYPIDISIESGIPYYYKKKAEEDNELLYSAPNPFGTGIQSLLNHPIKDIDPIWLLELHPKISKYSELNNSLSKKEAYGQLMDLIFSYSLISFVANLSSNYEESTYRGVHIPKNTININPKALRFTGPEIYSNSGKYIIWRNS
ncbi:hypothetical protein FG386_003689 [Cryptosporidium ryanae]|uniref:uncharacterized protein n=1 Tax=Cryptosporidium ryanae TaxID=515981 RepID=UPI00351A331D|nr:hypothetical protein FG386_003689 [Cryptosporidium ryanae]